MATPPATPRRRTRRALSAVILHAAVLALALAPWPAALADHAGVAAAPSLTITPDRGPCGSRITIRGAGFPSGEPIDLGERRTAPTPRQGSQIAIARAGADGTFAVELALPGCGPDPEGAVITIFATRRPADPRDNDTVLASAVFTLSSAPRCFAQTGHCVQGRFLDYWLAHGDLVRNGYPLSGERRERLEDGREYTVQYFERVRLEAHPENAPPHDVLIGQFGRRVLAAAYGEVRDYRLYREAVAPVAPLDGRVYFPETGHNLGGRFLAYWREHGGLAQFGYPITEEREDRLEDGRQYVTQYFERGRLEYHPEAAGTPYEVQIGQFGRQVLAETALLDGDFARLYLADPAVRERLGAPRGLSRESTGALQDFEAGRLLREGGARRIYVLAGTADAGRVLHPGPYGQEPYFPDSWAEGQDPGGGPVPGRPGRYYPRRGFGKVWREERLGERPGEFRLGYALTADETGLRIAVQEFAAGLLLAIDTPDGRVTYVVHSQRQGHASSPYTTYERRADPSSS